MGIFSSIKDAIFGKDKDDKKTPPAGHSTGTTTGQVPKKPEPTPIVNVENSLDSMPGADRLNWRTSIVDLMKLIGVDSSYENRKALATELGRADYSGSAEDNIWLHRRTMRELSVNGGKVPAEFLD